MKRFLSLLATVSLLTSYAGMGPILVPMPYTPQRTVRVPVSQFEGVDLSQVIGLAFSFDGPESDAIRLADFEFLAAL